MPANKSVVIQKLPSIVLLDQMFPAVSRRIDLLALLLPDLAASQQWGAVELPVKSWADVLLTALASRLTGLLAPITSLHTEELMRALRLIKPAIDAWNASDKRGVLAVNIALVGNEWFAVWTNSPGVYSLTRPETPCRQALALLPLESHLYTISSIDAEAALRWAGYDKDNIRIVDHAEPPKCDDSKELATES